jgi:uncharacterized membrane protein YwzB
MTEKQDQPIRIPLRRSRVIVVYGACFFGAALAPIESYISNGSVTTSMLVISLLAFITGAAVASFAMWQFKRKGKFLHYEARE